MSWRTFTILVSVWTVFAAGMQLTIFETFYVGVAILFAGWMAKLCYDKYRGKTIFRTCFVDHPPPHEQQIDRWGPHIIPPGDSEHYLRVTCNEALKVLRCNVRFIDPAELTLGPGEPLIDTRHIVCIKELSVSSRITTRGVMMTSTPDDKGGMHVTFSPPMELVAGESFVMKIFVQAQMQEWDGKISFRGHDQYGNRRSIRADVRIAPTGPI